MYKDDKEISYFLIRRWLEVEWKPTPSCLISLVKLLMYLYYGYSSAFRPRLRPTMQETSMVFQETLLSHRATSNQKANLGTMYFWLLFRVLKSSAVWHVARHLGPRCLGREVPKRGEKRVELNGFSSQNPRKRTWQMSPPFAQKLKISRAQERQRPQV